MEISKAADEGHKIC